MKSIQIRKIFLLVCMTYGVFTNSILFTSYSIILYRNYLNKWKKYFEMIFSRSLCLGFTSSNILPVCFLKHSCKQCSFHLDISSISFKTCYIFLRFNIVISDAAIFLATFNFTLITRHSIMLCDLESHTAVTKCCFGVR